MKKHTPSPWCRGEYDEHLGYDCLTGGIRVGPVVLDANNYGQHRSWDDKPWDRERMEADAALIEAAPVLLAAFENLIRDLDAEYGRRVVDTNWPGARRIIAEARGNDG